jgi:hypothetical protein
MVHKIKSKLTNRAARLALPARGAPYAFTNIERGIAVGYRRKQGAGSWVLRRADGKGGASVVRIGTADDYAEADGEHILDFWQASERARTLAQGGEGSGALVTWGKALDDYEAELRARGGDVVNASRVRHHLTPALSEKAVTLLTAVELRRWCNGLLKSGRTHSTVRRTLKAAAASLNRAANLDPRVTNRAAWKTAFAGIGDSSTPVNRVLDTSDVLKLVDGAGALEPNFGLFVDVLASTGTRTSQAAKLLVADLQDGPAPRLMMPSSKKGRGRKEITRKPVPITASLARKLAVAAGDRPGEAPLLTQADGRAWTPEDRKLGGLFAEVAHRAGIEATAYSLRHSSIVRSLLAGVPTRIVAAQHDTSTVILERVYSHFIMDHADVVARKGLLDTEEPVADNVVAMGRR